MIKLTQEEYEAKEAEIEVCHIRMRAIEHLLDADFDGEPWEETHAKNALNREYKVIEAKADEIARELRRSFVSEKWEDNASFDYQLTEMKA